MTGMLDLGPEELRARLLAFDRVVELQFPDRVFRLVIVGGGALVLLGYLARPTSDLDVLSVPRDLQPLIEDYDLSGRVNAFIDHFAYNMEDRLVPLDLHTEVVKCFTASLEDIVASKLHSDRPVDVTDIRNPEILAALDWNRLERVAAEMRNSALNERRYQIFLANYREYREEFGPCDS